MRPPLPRHAVRLGCLILAATSCRAPASGDSPAPAKSEPDASPASPPPGRAAFVVLTSDETIVIPTDPALAVERLPGYWVGALPGSPPGGFGTIPLEMTKRDDPQLPVLPVCPSGYWNGPCMLDDAIAMDANRRSSSVWGTVVARVEVAAGQPARTRFVDLRDVGTEVDGGGEDEDEGDEEDECSCVMVHGISTDGPALDLADPEVKQMIEMSPHQPEDYLAICDVPMEPELVPTSVLGGMLYSNGFWDEGGCDGWGRYYGSTSSVPLRPGAAAPTTELPAPPWCHLDVSLDSPALDAAPDEDAACQPSEDYDEMVAYLLRRGRLVRAAGSLLREGNEEADTACICVSGLPLTPDLCPSPLDPCGQGSALPGRDVATQWWSTTDDRLALLQREDDVAIVAAGRDAPIRVQPMKDRILGVEYHPDTALLGIVPPPREVRVPIPPLDGADAKFAGSPAAWGNRCFAHLKAGRLDAAEAACFAGLLAGGSDGTRGALTYNLGRIAEARGDRARARGYYERSQRLRPNDATAERLRALAGG